MLGPVRVWHGTTELELGPPQQRAALAVLLLREGRTVSLSELIDVLWGERPPATAVNVLHRYIGRLRRILEPDLPMRAPGRFLVRSSGGYRLDLAPEAVDLGRFRQLTEQARTAVGQGRPRMSVPLFIQALDLWQGPCGAGLGPEVLGHPLFTALEEERIAAVQTLADAALEAGDPHPVLPILRRTAVDHPWTESLHARLVMALAAAGQQAEALSRYESVRAGLAGQLGIDPGPELRAAHRKVLRQELPPAGSVRTGTAPASGPGTTPAPGPAPAQAEPPPGAPTVEATRRVRPAHLPAALPGFTGRDAETHRALAMLGPGDGAPATMVVAAVTGMAGIGKSTFALHWAHQVAARFPDGQLYVNLRGFDPGGDPLDPAGVVRGFLDALEVPPAQVPDGVDAQAALFRSLLTGRRMLLLIDNARDEEQVRPLLPGSAGHLVIVTSRNRLAGLIAREGAQPVALDLPDPDETRSVLVERLGAQRVAAEPGAVDEIVTRCGRLPLAVAIVAARAAANPTFSLAALAEELRATAGSLDAFSDTEPSTDARVAFSCSYRALGPAAARLFRLLALRFGPDLGTAAAAALAGLTPARTRPLLAELARAHLITERVPGRFVVHDLIGTYATEMVEQTESQEQRRAARRRLVDHYLHTGYAANRVIEPYRHPIDLPPPAEGAGPVRPADAATANAWFDTEYPVLLATVRQAADHGLEEQAWQLTWTMQQFFDRRGHWHDWIAALHVARDAAARRGDRAGLAHTYRGIGTVYSRLSRPEDSYRELDRSLALFGELGDGAAQAHLHLVLGAVKSRNRVRHRHQEAREHSRQALELFTAAGSTVGRARALNNLGFTSALLGDHQAALEHGQAALDLQQELGDEHGQAAAWDSVALALHRLGRRSEAIACYQRALAMFTTLGNRYFLAGTSSRLGDVYLDEGRPEQARACWEQALAVLDDLDHADAAQVAEKLRRTAEDADTTGTGTLSGRAGRVGLASSVQSSSQSFDARKISRGSRDS
ncbi:tetratricopeptide repeat protein [Kineosporia sp. J2-2]|uniref:Tetratricopeptide repeat protein n=1 Tax=Kineosporia corallincola TaxID=2835133 RepID=A0ABS5TQR1_9ACTN|nr:BTAD domain-containing putative transcriptional regulator [Kineosporia corallincola]MBT0772889.1 tetratricopeptide repeat protein [Kineosporia corallincola]